MSLTVGFFNSGIFKGEIFNGGIFRTSSTVSIVSLLFGSGERGLIYDISDFSTLYQDSAGTTPVTAVSQPVGKILDISGNNNHAYQSTASSRPILLQDAGGHYYLELDGVNDFLVTNNIDFTSTDKISVFTGIRKLSDSSQGAIIELTNNPSVKNTGTFYINSSGLAGENYEVYMRGNGVRSYYRPVTYTAPITNTVSALFNNSGVDLAIGNKPYVNAVLDQDGGASNVMTASTFSNAPIYIGRRGGATNPFNGRIYSMIVRGAQSSEYELAFSEAYVNSKTGAY